jgi:Fibronectin type III domain
MSQPATEPVSSPGGGKKLLGMNRQTVIIFGVALAGAMAYLLWKRGKSSSTTAANPNAQTGATGECTDANGNPTPCEDMAGIDYSGELSAIQTEVESIAAQGTGTTTTGTTTTTAAPAQVNQYPAVSFTAKKSTATAILVQWKALTSPTPLPTSYTVEAWQLNGKVASVQTVNAPDTTGGTGQVTIGGLTPKFCYNVRVWANGGKTAPAGATTKVCL